MMKPPSLTLGVEEEYQIVDPKTRALKSYINQILEQAPGDDAPVKPELHQSIVEVGTPPCETPAQVRDELRRLRGTVQGILQPDGLTIASAGSHPFSRWWDQEITPLERYEGVKHDMGDLAHRLLIFGMHIHVGVEDREFAVDVVNAARYFLPHLLCLTTSSPFWIGRNTGLKSYRSTVFRGFPRSGIPPRIPSWGAFQQYVQVLTDTHCIPNGSKIWWDVRPHYKYPTVEFRVCDACTRVDEAVCAAAIVQALVLKLYKLRRDNMTWRDYAPQLVDENKWRAMRFGLSGKLIDFGKQEECPAPQLIREMIDWFLGDAVDELGSRREIEYAYRILDEGSSADRQLATFERTGSLEAVVDQIIAETAEGVAVVPHAVVPHAAVRDAAVQAAAQRAAAEAAASKSDDEALERRAGGDRRARPRPESPLVTPAIRIGDLDIGQPVAGVP
ncbi:putative glutamate--cysteine ligase 2 [Gemmatimonadetes bacterium T265]|nr:putative glutamate--cysteine ligase 2 [Gemmatimonadetes bacterium T265]